MARRVPDVEREKAVLEAELARLRQKDEAHVARGGALLGRAVRAEAEVTRLQAALDTERRKVERARTWAALALEGSLWRQLDAILTEENPMTAQHTEES